MFVFAFVMLIFVFPFVIAVRMLDMVFWNFLLFPLLIFVYPYLASRFFEDPDSMYTDMPFLKDLEPYLLGWSKTSYQMVRLLTYRVLPEMSFWKDQQLGYLFMVHSMSMPFLYPIGFIELLVWPMILIAEISLFFEIIPKDF